MMFVTSILCCYYQLPSQLENSAKSLLAATFSVSNIYFLITTNYFSNNDTKPFLPTWSLAVEEQFYIFFPLFLLLIRRYFPGRFKIAIVGVAIAGSHAVSATRTWINDLEIPPGELAKLKWEQAKHAAASGATTWREHPNSKARLVRRSVES